MPISPLDRDTARLIKTSQVVTSVSSAVKELLENALDANARNIEIHLRNGGAALIEVKDDGLGISREDAASMALPSYTSKITSYCDLESLKTYGFRGEALAALCGLADVTIITKTNEDENAMVYIMDEYGRVKESQTCHGSTGTVVKARDLFKRLPVRRQLISNDKIAAQEIKSSVHWIKSYAIVKYSVRMSLRVDGNRIFSKPAASSMNDALGYIHGKRAMSSMSWLRIENAEMSAQLMVPSRDARNEPEILYSSAQYIFVNDRPIRHKLLEKLLTKTIFEGLSTEPHSRRRPMFLLYMWMSAKDIDVNVEPNKTSVFLKAQEHILSALEMHVRTFYGLACEPPQTEENLDLSSYPQDSTVNEEEEHDDTGATEAYSKKQKLAEGHAEAGGSGPKESHEPGSSGGKDSAEGRWCSVNAKGSARELNLSDAESEHEMSLALSPKSREVFLCVAKEAMQGIAERSRASVCPRRTDVPVALFGTVFQVPGVDLGATEEANVPARNTEMQDEAQGSMVQRADAQCAPVANDENCDLLKEPTAEVWSKGHLLGLKGGTDIESYVESYIRSGDSSELRDESFLPSATCTGLVKFLRETVPQVTGGDPRLSVAQTAQKVINRWKSLPVEERGYYRDVVRAGDIESSGMEERKRGGSPVNHKKNKKRILSMLDRMESMSVGEASNLVMRTTVPQDIDLEKIGRTFWNDHCAHGSDPLGGNANLVAGRLSSHLWIINYTAYLWALDVRRLKEGLNVSNLADSIEESPGEVERLLRRYLGENENLSLLHPICPLRRTAE